MAFHIWSLDVLLLALLCSSFWCYLFCLLLHNRAEERKILSTLEQQRGDDLGVFFHERESVVLNFKRKAGCVSCHVFNTHTHCTPKEPDLQGFCLWNKHDPVHGEMNLITSSHFCPKKRSKNDFFFSWWRTCLQSMCRTACWVFNVWNSLNASSLFYLLLSVPHQRSLRAENMLTEQKQIHPVEKHPNVPPVCEALWVWRTLRNISVLKREGDEQSWRCSTL